MIYFDGKPVAQMGEDWAELTDGSRAGGIHDMSLFTDDSGGGELFERRMAMLREKRNRLLAESDWTQMPDNDLTNEEVFAWREYRRALRDLPATITMETLDTVEWPGPPFC